jgi:hypothetical protein
MREHCRESFRKVSTCENFRKFSITRISQWLCISSPYHSFIHLTMKNATATEAMSEAPQDACCQGFAKYWR